MIREKIEDRRFFTIDEKIQLLNKTDFRCAHCGKKLGYSGVTIDHAIPISKAGTNDDINIIPLCEKCNKEKGNLIIPPEYYYFYLRKEYLKDLIEAYEEYLGNVDYLSENNFLPIDYYSFASNSADIILNDKSYVNSPKRVYLIKSQKREMNEVYSTYLKYFSKNKVRLTEFDKKALLNEIDNWYRHGAIYTLRNVQGDIVLVIPMRLQYCDLEDHVVQPTKPSLVLSLGRVAIIYKKNNYVEGLIHFLLYLTGNGISIYNDVFSVYVGISFCDFEKDIIEFTRRALKLGCELRVHTIQRDGAYMILTEGVNVPYKESLAATQEYIKILQNRSNVSYKDTERLACHYKMSDEVRKNIEKISEIPSYDNILCLGSVYRG